MTPRPRAASVPRAAALCCTNPRVSAATLYTAQRKGAPRGRSLKPCLSFPFTFFFSFGREKNRVFDSALFMFLLGNKRWLCVCVFSCVGFLKKWEEEKKFSAPFLDLASPFGSFDRSPLPFLFCFVLLRVHIPVCNPWFARFSVFSKVSLRQLGSPPPSSPAGAWRAGRGLARFPPPTPPPLSPLSAPSSSPCWERAESGRPRRARTSGAQRAPSRRAWARGRLMSRLGKGLGVFDLRLELANAPLPFGKERFRGGKGTAPAQGRKEEADTY